MSFLSDLVNRSQAVVAQVNPFDNGRTYNTVRTNGASYAPKAPTPVFQQAKTLAVNNPVTHFVEPIAQTAGALGTGLYNIGNIPHNFLRTDIARLTGNQTAENNAANDTMKGLNAAKGFVQGAGSMAVQLGESANPFGGDVYQRQFTPTNKYVKALVGNNSIPSMQMQFKQQAATNGRAFAMGAAVTTAIMDAMGAKGGAEGGLKIAKAGAPIAADAARAGVQAAKSAKLIAPENQSGFVRLPGGTEEAPKPAPAPNVQSSADSLANNTITDQAVYKAIKGMSKSDVKNLADGSFGSSNASAANAARTQSLEAQGLITEKAARDISGTHQLTPLGKAVQTNLREGAVPTGVHPAEALKQEALKYKNADAFVQNVHKQIENPANGKSFTSLAQEYGLPAKDQQILSQVEARRWGTDGQPKTSTYPEAAQQLGLAKDYQRITSQISQESSKRYTNPYGNTGVLGDAFTRQKLTNLYAEAHGAAKANPVVDSAAFQKYPSYEKFSASPEAKFLTDQGFSETDIKKMYDTAQKSPVAVGTVRNGVKDTAQQQFEQAYNSKDMAAAQKFANQIKEPAAKQAALDAIGRNTAQPTNLVKAAENVTNPFVKKMIEDAQKVKEALDIPENNQGGFIGGDEPKPPKKAETPKAEAPKGKERGLTRNMKKSDEFSPELKEKISSSYQPFTNKAATMETEQFMKQPLKKAQAQVMQTLAHSPSKMEILKDQAFGKQEVSNAGAVMKALDAKGDNEGANAIHDLLAEKLTKAGQTGQAASLIYNRTPQGLMNRALRDLKGAGVEITPELRDQINTAKQAIIDTKDGTRENDLARARFAKTVGKKIPTSAGTKLVALWKTGILSSPKTAVKVGAVQPITGVAEQLADLAGKPFDVAASIFTHKSGYAAPNAQNIAYGLKTAFTTGAKDAKTRFAENIAMPHSTGMAGDELGANGFKAEGANFGVGKGGKRTVLDRATGGASSKFLNGYTTAVGRVHGALQTMWYEGRHAQSLMQTAQAEAKNAIKAGKIKPENQQAFIDKFLQKPPKWAEERAELSAQYATSQQKTALGSAAKGLQKTLPGGQIIAPITRIPGAVATQVVNYSPAGFLKTGVKAIADAKNGKAFDQAAFSRGMGRAVIGSGIMLGGAKIYSQGRMSGQYPSDKATQTLWQNANIPANSIYVGGKAYPGQPWKNSGGTWLQVGSPGGAPAQAALTGGVAQDALQKGGVTNAALQGAAGAAKIITDQPYLTGISGAMTAINTPSQAKTFYDQTAGSIVPNIVKDFATATDPLQRQTSVQSPVTSAKNAVTNAIPSLREKNQPQVDVFGNNITRNNVSNNNKTNVINSLLNPYNPQKSNPSAITNALGDIHSNVDQNNKPLTIPTQIAKKYNITVNGKTVPLTDAQRTQFIKQSGQASQSEIYKLMNSPQWQNATPAQRSAMLTGANGVVTGQRDLAKQSFGSTTKLTSAGTAAKQNNLPMISAKGGVTNTIANTISKNLSGSDSQILTQYKSMSAQQRNQTFASQNNAQYLYDKANYNNKVAQGTLTTAQKISGAQTLAKEQVGSNYSQNTRQIFDLSKSEINSYLSGLPTPQANAQYQQLYNYGADLVNAGLATTNKIASLTSGSSSGSSSTGSKANTTLAAADKKLVSDTASLAKKSAGAKIKKISLASKVTKIKSSSSIKKISAPKPPKKAILASAVTKSPAIKPSRITKKGVLVA